MPTDLLVSKQNRDGGWPYDSGSSRTEPTVYALLALLATGETQALNRGFDWLRARQLSDGGWPPQMAFDESTWVTALVALLPPEKLGAAAHARAIQWLLRTQGEETTPGYRFRQWLLGNSTQPESEFPGWPWNPGAAAWVGPTSLAILALSKEHRRKASDKIRARIHQGRTFLLRRMCLEGGWNHGSVRALGYESHPYPETTGMGLAALRGIDDRGVPQTIGVAQRFLGDCHSADACNWLRLGLLAHGQLPAGYCPPARIAYRTLMEISLDLIAAEAQKGRDCFWA
jgi:hypothetical protein